MSAPCVTHPHPCCAPISRGSFGRLAHNIGQLFYHAVKSADQRGPRLLPRDERPAAGPLKRNRSTSLRLSEQAARRSSHISNRAGPLVSCLWRRSGGRVGAALLVFVCWVPRPCARRARATRRWRCRWYQFGSAGSKPKWTPRTQPYGEFRKAVRPVRREEGDVSTATNSLASVLQGLSPARFSVQKREVTLRGRDIGRLDMSFEHSFGVLQITSATSGCWQRCSKKSRSALRRPVSGRAARRARHADSAL